jgi:hypothetical protein
LLLQPLLRLLLLVFLLLRRLRLLLQPLLQSLLPHLLLLQRFVLKQPT